MAGAFDHARDDQYRTALDSCGDSRCRTRATLFRARAARSGVGCLLCYYDFDHQVVATDEVGATDKTDQSRGLYLWL